MKKGTRFTRVELEKVERLFRQNPGMGAADYIPLIKRETGQTVGIASVYRYMKRWKVPTATQSSSAMSIVSLDERETLRRLMEHMELPDLAEVSARWKLARGGVSVVKRRGGGEIRLTSEDGENISGCWLGKKERQFVEEILQRADAVTGNSLLVSFRELHEESAECVNDALQLQRSMASEGEWRTIGAQDQTPRQVKATDLKKALLDLRAKLEEFKSEVRLVTGA